MGGGRASSIHVFITARVFVARASPVRGKGILLLKIRSFVAHLAAILSPRLASRYCLVDACDANKPPSTTSVPADRMTRSSDPLI